MEVGRFILAAAFFGLAVGSFFLFTDGRDGMLSLTAVELQPMGSGMALVAQIENPGGADRLTGIGTDAASNATIVRATGDVVIPAEGSPSLAMDGAHGMLMGVHDQLAPGQLIPVTLWFENAGRYRTRARVVEPMMMDHSAAFDVPEDQPKPTIALSTTRDGDDWLVTLETTDFTFSETAVDSPHQPGVGHAHLYLNGLKLQRMYGPEARISALLPGLYELHVTLNTNDHQTYSVDGQPVTAATMLTVD